MLQYLDYDDFDRSTIGFIMGFLISNFSSMLKRARNEQWDDIIEDIKTIIDSCVSIQNKIRK